MNKKFLFGLLVLLALSPPAWAQERYKVTYRLSFVMTGGHSPMYLALDKGYFDQAGLAVEIFEGRGTGQNMQLMAAGVETFVEADFAQVAKAISEALSIKAVFGRYQLGPLSVIFLTDTGIRSPRDLIGKNMGTFPGSSDGLAFPALLKANGVDVNAVKLARTGPQALIPLLMERKLDAVLLHFHDNVPLLESKGAKVSFLKYSDWGVSVLGVGIIANPKTIKESPDLIRRFARAMAEGYKYAQAHPEESVDAVMKRGARGTREAQLKTLLNSFELMQTLNTKGRPLGWMSKKDWESTQELMLLYGGMKKRMPVEEFYTNEFIPE